MMRDLDRAMKESSEDKIEKERKQVKEELRDLRAALPGATVELDWKGPFCVRISAAPAH